MNVELAARFTTLVTDKLANGEVAARKAYLRSIIDVVKVGETKVWITGERATLGGVMVGKATNIRGFDRKWRTGDDDDGNSSRWTVIRLLAQNHSELKAGLSLLGERCLMREERRRDAVSRPAPSARRPRLPPPC